MELERGIREKYSEQLELVAQRLGR